jgi:hypothetical protein
MHDARYLADASLLHRDALRRLPAGYVLIDYSYTIRDNALPTFHRDVHVEHARDADAVPGVHAHPVLVQ